MAGSGSASRPHRVDLSIATGRDASGAGARYAGARAGPLERHGDAEGAANAGLAVAGRGRYPPAQWRALALKADFARPTGRPGDADADAYAAPASGVVRAVTDPLPGAFRGTLLASADVPA